MFAEPLEVLEPGGDTSAFTKRDAENSMTAAKAMTISEDDQKRFAKEESAKILKKPTSSLTARPLQVYCHFLKGAKHNSYALKLKLPPSWDDRTVDEAVIQPFLAAYDKKYPEAPATPQGPFTRVKLLVWAGPNPCASDRFRDPERDGIEDIKIAAKPIHCLFDVDEAVGVLRKRAHNKLKPTVELELIKAESTAIVVRTMPSMALLAPGEQLMAMLQDTKSGARARR